MRRRGWSRYLDALAVARLRCPVYDADEDNLAAMFWDRCALEGVAPVAVLANHRGGPDVAAIIRCPGRSPSQLTCTKADGHAAEHRNARTGHTWTGGIAPTRATT